jgi:hypothetical protein
MGGPGGYHRASTASLLTAPPQMAACTPVSTAHPLRGLLVVATTHWHDLIVGPSPDVPLSLGRVGDT